MTAIMVASELNNNLLVVVAASAIYYGTPLFFAGLGSLAGVGGACFSLSIVPTWQDGMTAGRGWIAIALVIFGFWRPDLTLVGAYLFGAFSSLSLTLQARKVEISPSILESMPYVVTILVLVVVSGGWAKRRLGAPAALGLPYEREDR